jgi:hypothetical protein
VKVGHPLDRAVILQPEAEELESRSCPWEPAAGVLGAATTRKSERIDKIGGVTSSLPPDGADPTEHDREAKTRQGPERRRTSRKVISDEMKAAARSRSRGTCECSNENCWHFRRCKAPGVAYLSKRSASGVAMCALFCRECARTAGGRQERL